MSPTRLRPTPWILVTALLALPPLLAGCPKGDGEGTAEITPAGPPTRESLTARLEQVKVALEAGEAGAEEQLQALGRDALTMPDAEAASAVAQLLVAQGRYDDALDYIGEAEAQYTVETGRKALWFPEAQAHDEMGRPGRAAEVFARALEVPPNNPFEYSGLADLWVAADEFDQAAGAVDRGLVAFPGDVILLQARAEVLLRRGQAAEALVQLDELASANPDDVAIAVLRMEALAVLDRRAELRAAGKAFEQAYPLLGHGTIFVGLVAAREGDQVTADAAWDRVDALNAECVECTTDQAQMLAWARAQAPAAKVEPLDR